ncbi:sodium/potassium-transporting ATPase subunit beta-1-interacting protein 2-like isoform X1 [Lethenteron reissneri]|uniref:sodium/potassium-transporting ATPase subunit beta-1-interacting protein 2-like isoform X1 n=1 Tax=Lethenteron reissneri TaxID=7753 RepID=UPI002AB70837|nr:sodium/potassium-transporting ATPase subunit beta-1-interacting protein 2-like isoform X1 [Lethenteron reissneri]
MDMQPSRPWWWQRPSVKRSRRFADSDLLTFNISYHRSWWRDYGSACPPAPPTALPGPSVAGDTVSDGLTGPVAVGVVECPLEFQFVEVIHSACQIVLALVCFVCACYVISVFTEEEDSFDFIGGFDSYAAYRGSQKMSYLQLQPLYLPK